MNKQINEKIFLWRDNLETLPSEIFFNLVHIYLGEVRTPYNKQKLIEQLEAFFRNAQNQKAIVALLDSFDREIISFILLVPNTTAEKLSTFFSDEYSKPQIAARLQNLHERLIIYTDSEKSPHKFVHINPVLEEILSQNISSLTLLHDDESKNTEKYHPNPASILSAGLLASFISYVMEHPDLCKADGTFKKSDATKLDQIFPQQLDLVQNLLTALSNLLIINNSDKTYTINNSRLQEFAKLPEKIQYAYLCAAAACPMSRTLLQTQAQLLIDTMSSIPPKGYSRKNLLRMAFLISETEKFSGVAARSHGRFSRMLAASIDTDESMAREDRSAQILFDRIIDTAIIFGILVPAKEAGNLLKNTDGNVAEKSTPKSNKVITISGLSITVVPGLTLLEYTHLIPFLSVVKYNTVINFELSHQSIFRAFDAGYNAEKIYSILQEYSAFDIPQNIHATIDDWEQSYHSAILYKGYVLKLDEKKSQIFEKNKKAYSHVIIKISEGVYLLDITTDEEASIFTQKSGFDFIGSTKGVVKENTSLPFANLSLSPNNFLNLADSSSIDAENTLKTIVEGEKIKKELHKAIDTLEIPKNTYDALSARIARKIIISKEQLAVSFVPQALVEAHGVDFSGKINILESALQAHEKVSVIIPDENKTGSLITYTGVPLFVNKKNGVAELVLQLEKSNDIKKFSIAQLANIKWHKKL